MFTQARKKLSLGSLSLIFGMILLIYNPVVAETVKPEKLFKNISELEITLTGPWRSLKKNKKKDGRFPAKLAYQNPDGSHVDIDIEVAPRGITRRMKVCAFPPLKVFFDKEKTKNTIFRGNRSLKLVSYCQPHSRFEQYYLKEFLSYQVYNLITKLSFRARPAIVEYIDSEQKIKTIQRFSFFIEDIDDVAKRNKQQKHKNGKIRAADLDALQTSYFSLFQLLIGNLDWSATTASETEPCCHNSRIISAVGQLPKYVIPYDFDSSGLVNTHYAMPPEGIKLKNIRERLYRGYCAHNQKLAEAAAHFQQQKTKILDLFINNSRLNAKTRENALEYIEGFYAILNNPQRFQREIIDKCRG